MKKGANASRCSSTNRRIVVFGGFMVNPLMYPKGLNIQRLTDAETNLPLENFGLLKVAF